MCGICGFISDQVIENSQSVINNMAAAILHRGREAGGHFIEKNMAFAHRRLSIIDLDARSNQPMISADRRFVITFNGEIYNFLELKKKLGNHAFKTTSDTEVLLELWAVYGPECLQLLNGMFAFSIYDRDEETLFCARDRLGVKPFCYWHNNSSFVFASEAKSILKYPSVCAEIDYNSLSDYLSLGYVTGQRTIFKGIKKLNPAHYLKFSHGRIEEHCYWNLPEKISAERSYSAEDILELLDSSVKYRLISDVPVGSFLSGGIDSAAVTTLAAKKSNDLQTFTIGFKEKAFDESKAAAELSAKLGLINHTDFFQQPDLPFLQNLVKFFDQPFADTSTLPFFQLCQNAAKNIRTVLCGDGGDELFAGYETRRADLMALTGYRSIPFWPRLLKLASWVMKAIPADHGKVSTNYKLRQFFAFAHLSPEQSHFSWRLLFDENEKNAILHPELAQKSFGHQTWNNTSMLFEKVKTLPMLKQQAVVDLQSWLADDILYKADQASMAHTLEVRAPFLDYRLVEAAFSIPEEKKFSLYKTKTFLRKSLSPVVPAEILNRKKEGFGSPVSIWMEGNLSNTFFDCVHDSSFKKLFPDTQKIMKIHSDHCNRIRDNGYRLWALLMLALWQKEWISC